MITMSQTKSANYLFIVAVLKSMREGGVITLAESEQSATTRNSPAPISSSQIKRLESSRPK